MAIIRSLLILLISLAANASTTPTKTVLITGGLSGLGKEISLAFHNAGWEVWATSRNPSKHQAIAGINARKLDLMDPVSAKQLVKEIQAKSGRIDVLINNAGYAVMGPEETISINQARDLMNINVIGPLVMMQECLPLMRAQKGGHIINISSTAALRAVPGAGVYSASKMALEGLSEALAAEVAQWNVHVTLVEPGSINNGSLKRAPLTAKLSDYPGYKSFTNKLVANLTKRAEEVGQDPQEVALLTLQIATNPKPNLRYQANSGAAALAQEILIDPTGNKMRDKTLSWAKDLYEVSMF